MDDSKNIPQKPEPKSSWDEDAPIFFMNWKEAVLGEIGMLTHDRGGVLKSAGFWGSARAERRRQKKGSCR
jgi:hypothetical protein